MATQVEIAEHLDLSDRQVRKLVKSGILPASKGSGGLSFDDCRMAYIRYLRGINSGSVQPEAPVDPEMPNRELEDALWTRARRIAQETENEVKIGELAYWALIEEVGGAVSESIRSTLDAIPLKVKNRHPDLPATVIENIRREVVKAQNAAAKYRITPDQVA